MARWDADNPSTFVCEYYVYPGRADLRRTISGNHTAPIKIYIQVPRALHALLCPNAVVGGGGVPR